MVSNQRDETSYIEQYSKRRIRVSSYILALYILLLPISTALAGAVGESSVQNYIALIYFFLVFIENCYSRKIVLKRILFPVYAYFLYTLISSIWNFSLELNWYFFQFAITTLMVFCITSRSYLEKEYDLFKKAIYSSAVIVLVVSVINISSAFSYRLTIIVTSAMDPNDFACGLSVIIALCLTEILRDKKKILNYIIVLLMIIIIFLAGSRGAMVMALAMLLTWILYTNGTKRVKIVLFVIVGALLLYFLAFDNATSFLLNRFTISDIIEGGGAGRYKIWSAALKQFSDSNILRMLNGYGHGGFRDAVNYVAIGHSTTYESHNMFINELIEGGIIGLILLINCFVRIIKISRNSVFSMLLIVGFIVEGLTLDAQVFRVFAIVISFAYIWSVREDNRREYEGSNG